MALFVCNANPVTIYYLHNAHYLLFYNTLDTFLQDSINRCYG